MSDPKLGFGTNHCLCPKCGEYFTTVANFDAHREGKSQDRRCVDPATKRRKDGSARYRLNAQGLWASPPKTPDGLTKIGYYRYGPSHQ